MSENQEEPSEKLLISFSDIRNLFSQSRKKIAIYALIFGVIGLLLPLRAPISYKAEGTFREKSIKSGAINNSLLQFFSTGSNSESEAISLIKSRKLMNEVIQKLHMQGELNAHKQQSGLINHMYLNWNLAWSAFKKKNKPALVDPFYPLKLESIHYTGEIPLTFLIDLKEKGEYLVSEADHPHVTLGKGQLGKPFHWEHVTFTLLPPSSDHVVTPQLFSLNVNSVPNLVKYLENSLLIEPSKTDKGVIKLTYSHPNRHFACQFVNTVMECYQEHIKTEHSLMAGKQLDYLSLRRDQLSTNLSNLMEKHADHLSNDLNNSGFINSTKEMEFLAESLHEYKQKLLDNELEIKRLENVQLGGFAYYDRYSNNDGDAENINSTLREMRNLKQQRDALEIDLQKKIPKMGYDIQKTFTQQMDELHSVQGYLVELHVIMDQFQKGELPDLDSKLFNNSRFVIKGWTDRVRQAQQENAESLPEIRESFKFYLSNLERLFGVHERILHERLTHQQNPSEEYQGISLKLAIDLYLEYSKNLIQMESTVRQNLFFIHQMEDPNFEITSLSAGLEDSVSREIIQKARELILNLRDQNNQSIREQQRIQDELNLQRTFLIMHLKQMVQLMELNKELIDEKIAVLQNVSLELIHQQISLLEKSLQEYVEVRLRNLKQERSLINRHVKEIHVEMTSLPRKWAAEQLIEQEVDTNQLIVEEIAKLVETKNISHNLDVIQSAPIDEALAPVHPQTPNLLFSGLAGLLMGGLIGSGVVLGRSLSKGLPVSADNLKMMGCKVAGPLSANLRMAPSNLSEEDLHTLRRLQTELEYGYPKNTSAAKSLLLLEGEGPDYAPYLADLLIKRGNRVLSIYLDDEAEKQMSPSTISLATYLQTGGDLPTIQKGPQGDWIAAGKRDRFGVERLSSPRFQQLLQKLDTQYEWILAISHARPLSAEAESLLLLFPAAAMTVHNEIIEEIKNYSQLLEKNPSRLLIFLLSQ